MIYNNNILRNVLIEDLLKARREEILKISAKHGAFNVRVFGSAARGEAGEGSDIHLLVDVGANWTPFFQEECSPTWRICWAVEWIL